MRQVPTGSVRRPISWDVTLLGANHREHQTSIDWRFTTEEARIKLKHLYPEIVEPSNDPNPS
jgi:hypothetical protein